MSIINKSDPTNSANEFVLTHEFNAPLALVWKAWTDRAALAEWWGPKSFKLEVAEFDFRPGGIFHYSMTTPDGTVIWGRFTYREIEAPTRMTYVSSFADEKANIASNPWLPIWPSEILNFFHLTETVGKTTLHLRAYPIDSSSEEADAFVGLIPNMRGGWAGTLEKLTDYLKKNS